MKDQSLISRFNEIAHLFHSFFIFSRLLSVLPADTQKVITTGSSLENSEVFTPSSPSRDEESGPAPKMKRRKSTKGWDGEDPAARFTDTLEITGKHHNILHLVIHLFTSSP